MHYSNETSKQTTLIQGKRLNPHSDQEQNSFKTCSFPISTCCITVISKTVDLRTYVTYCEYLNIVLQHWFCDSNTSIGIYESFSSLVTEIISFGGIRTWIPSDVHGQTIRQCRYCTVPTLWQMPFLLQIGRTVPSSNLSTLEHPGVTVLLHDKIKTWPLKQLTILSSSKKCYYICAIRQDSFHFK